jgi:hypothetical protein
MRRILLIVALVAAFGVMATAQDETPMPERELITVLKMGDGIFEPDLWLASGSENIASTTATWQATSSSGFSALSFLNYLHFDSGYTLDGLDEFFNDDWFARSFANWEDLQKTNVCYNGDLTLHEFTLAFRDPNDNVTHYGLRYWVEPVSETRVRAWHLAVATTYSDGTPNAEGQDLLDEYAARMYPDLPSCES